LEAQRAHAGRVTTHAKRHHQQAQSALSDLQKTLRKKEGNLKSITSQNSNQRFIKGKNKEATQKADRSAAFKIHQLKRQTASLQKLEHHAKRERVKPLRLDGTRAADTLAVLDQVSFSYSGSDIAVFCNVDAQLEPTDRVLVRSSNGCGKSTLVRLLLGELEPTHGKVVRRICNVVYFPQTLFLISSNDTEINLRFSFWDTV
jgi:ATPase subunit of ABC transporter with duplicated ATPase domains